MNRKRLAMWIGALTSATAMAIYMAIYLWRKDLTAPEIAEGIGYSLTMIVVAGVTGCIAIETGYWLHGIFRSK